jgi:hypothetical protein
MRHQVRVKDSRRFGGMEITGGLGLGAWTLNGSLLSALPL